MLYNFKLKQRQQHTPQTWCTLILVKIRKKDNAHTKRGSLARHGLVCLPQDVAYAVVGL